MLKQIIGKRATILNMDETKTNLAERLKKANNVLVCVSRNPSVDQLSALLGLGLFLNKLGKHCAAVFSGEIPSTLEFLKPESTIQKNTDSLRDFIIALDKSKADKLRYKVEDNVVRIFITPYRSSIGQDDLEFSQGDFNVDVVVALGVSEQTDLDEAITAHGRILHDATVASINTETNGNLGSINWNDNKASSLSEMISQLTQIIDPDALDEQIATALLTGIVANTERFSNDKTSATTMTASSILMAAGANQQLVVTKLEEPNQQVDKPKLTEEPQIDQPAVAKTEPGTLEISHDIIEDQPKEASIEPEETDDNFELPEPQETTSSNPSSIPAGLSPGPKLVTEPPSLGGTLTANAIQNDIEPVTDPLSLPQTDAPSIIGHKADTTTRAPFKPLENLHPPQQTDVNGLPHLSPPPAGWQTENEPADEPTNKLDQVHIDEHGNFKSLQDKDTLSDIEKEVHSPHIKSSDINQVDEARAAIDEAFVSGPNNSLPKPNIALNAQPLGEELHPESSDTPPPVPPPFNPMLS